MSDLAVDTTGTRAPINATPAAVHDLLAQHDPAFDAFWARMVPRESGGADVPNYRYDPIHTASGPAQITDTNWRAYAPKLGIDITRFPTAMSAPADYHKATAKLMYRSLGEAPWDQAHGGSLPVGEGAQRGPIDRIGAGYERVAGEYRKEQQQILAAIDALDKDSPDFERRVREATDRANAASEALLRATAAKPEVPTQEAFGHFGSIATIIGMLGGLMTRQPLMGMLNGGAAAMEAANQGDWRRYHAALDVWKTQSDMLLRISDLQQRRLDAILTEKHRSLSDKLAKLQYFLGASRMGVQADLASVQGLGAIANLNVQWQKANNEATLLREKLHMDFLNEGLIRARTKYLEQGATKPGTEGDFTRNAIRVEEERLGRPLTDAERGMITRQAHADWAKAGATGRGEAGYDLSQKIYGDQTIGMVADSYIAGNMQAMVGLARQQAGSYAMARVWNAIADKLSVQETREFREVYGREPDAQEQKVLDEDRGRRLAIAQAEFQGIRAGERTAFTRAASLVTAAAEAKQFTPQALETSRAVSRYQYPDINKIDLAAEEKLGHKNVVDFYVATLSLADAFAQVIGRGNTQMTDAARTQAISMLNRAWSEGQYETAVRRINLEIDAAQKAPEAVVKRFREGFLQRPFAAPTAPVGAVPPVTPGSIGHPPWAQGSATGPNGEKIYTDGAGWFHADHSPVR